MAIGSIAGTRALLAFVGVSLSSCALMAKAPIEDIMNRRVGQVASKAFLGYLVVTCGVRREGEYGCLSADAHDCRVWYVVDEQTDVIKSWRYVGPPENCWAFRGH